MIKRITTFLIVAVAFFSTINAAIVTETQARDIAGRFFNVTMPQQPATMKGRGATAAYYVFNNPQQPGWVIVAGDDRARTILAYGDEDYFDAEEVPECVQDWLGGYAEQIEAIDAPINNTPDPLEASVIAATKTKIVPLLFSKWDQGLPFNQECPSYTTSSGSTTAETQYSPAGCVEIGRAHV